MPAVPGLESNPLWWAALALAGLAVGTIGGMFGVGGNFLLIPILNVGFGVPIGIAVGTSLCQIIGTGVAALVRHQRLRQGEIKIDWIMLLGGLMGAQAGANLLADLARRGTTSVLGHSIPTANLVIAIIYVVLLSLVAFWMIRDAGARGADEPLGAGPLTRVPLPPFTNLPAADRRVSVFIMAWLGLLLGFLSGLVGMGGGVVLMPILIYGVGVRLRMAAGTGILALVVSAVAGTWAHARLGNVDLRIAMTLLIGSTFGAAFGATLTSSMDGRRLRGLFGWLVLLTAIAVFWNLLRSLELL
jgi:uncharacterized membrane protein YfcA